jgi:hypothetical protein
VQVLRPHDAGPRVRGLGAQLAAGDFDGDGYSDLAVNVSVHLTGERHPNRGAVFLFRGGPHGLTRPTRRLVQKRQPADTTVEYGTDISATDINGDGYADLRVSSDYYVDDDEDPTYTYTRSYLGSAKGLGAEVSRRREDRTWEQWGDINGDGRPDLVRAGSAGHMVISRLRQADGTLSPPHRLTTTQLQAGRVGPDGLAGVTLGDINGDKYDDVVIGDPEAPAHGKAQVGTVIVLLGGSSGLSAARATVLREQDVHSPVKEADEFGSSVAIGDVTGDGHSELVVGAPSFEHQGPGAIYVFRGSAKGLSPRHPQRLTQASPGVPGTKETGAGFGSAVRIVDIVGDSHADVVVAVPEHNGPGHDGFYAGYVDVLPGTRSGVTGRNAIGLPGNGTLDYFGVGLA